MTFFDPFYWALGYIGYHDPVHPPFTHFPIALVTAALFFGVIGWWFRRPGFWTSAKHCLVLAWLFIFPTVLFGFMDWQHYYRGDWIFLIFLKICLASFLFVLLSIGLILLYKGRGESPEMLAIFLIGFFTVVALGYMGGKVVFEGVGGAGASQRAKAGEKIFRHNCHTCHAGGRNLVLPQYPLKGSKHLASYADFMDFIRDPRLPNGKKGPMPVFSQQKITDREAHQLYQYLIHRFGKP